MRVLTMILLLAALSLIGGGLWLYAPDKPRADLEAKYAARPSEFLSVAGLRLHVRDTGPKTAPVVIMLHGLGSSLHTWEPWATGLSSRYRVVRYDLPGFGLTGADPDRRLLRCQGCRNPGCVDGRAFGDKGCLDWQTPWVANWLGSSRRRIPTG